MLFRCDMQYEVFAAAIGTRAWVADVPSTQAAGVDSLSSIHV